MPDSTDGGDIAGLGLGLALKSGLFGSFKAWNFLSRPFLWQRQLLPLRC